MRSLIISLIIFGTVPFVLMRPYFGLLVYSWISFMSPHRLTYGFAYDFPFAMMIGALLIVSWLVSREPKALPLNAVTVLIIMLAFWECVTTIFAIEVVRPWWMTGPNEMWVRVMKVMSMTILTAILLTNRARIDGYLWVIVGSIGFFALKGGIFTLLVGGRLWVHGPAGSMIAENNAMGVATIMVVPLVRYLQLQATNKHIRRGLMVLMPLMVLSAFGSQSRGALIAISAMAAFMLMKSRHKMAVGVSTIVLAVAILSFLPQSWYDRMATIRTYDQDKSAMTRINAWTTAFNLALDRPMVGGGFKVLYFNPEVFKRYSPDPNAQAVAHSIYFQTLGEHGFPGLIFFVAILYLSFRNGRWLIKNTRDRPELQWARDLGAMIQVSLIGYAVGGAFLELANYDLYWGIVVVAANSRIIVAKELAKRAESPPAETEAALATAAPAVPRKSFLRNPGDAANPFSFRRG